MSLSALAASQVSLNKMNNVCRSVVPQSNEPFDALACKRKERNTDTDLSQSSQSRVQMVIAHFQKKTGEEFYVTLVIFPTGLAY